jgi:hypothetical protein
LVLSYSVRFNSCLDFQTCRYLTCLISQRVLSVQSESRVFFRIRFNMAMVNKEETLISVDKSTTEGPNSPAQQTLPLTSDRISINSACVACRSKHLKCDGLRVCSRCSIQQIPCVYLKSRRGYRGSGSRGKNLLNRDSVLNHNNQSADTNGVTDGNEMSLSAFTFSSNPLSTNFSGSMLTSTGARLPDKGVSVASLDGRNVQRSIDVFYQHFHESHPFLPPRRQLLRVLKLRPMPHLLTAMSYIASRYITGGLTAAYAVELESLFQSQPAKDASLVQAMLLYALGLDGAGEQAKAVDILLKAQNLALEIGMNTREYATTHGQDSSICEESLRRSWHELYIVCVMVAGFHGQRPFYHQDVDSFVPLPCEARDYESGVSTWTNQYEPTDYGSQFHHSVLLKISKKSVLWPRKSTGLPTHIGYQQRAISTESCRRCTAIRPATLPPTDWKPILRTGNFTSLNPKEHVTTQEVLSTKCFSKLI